MKNIILAIGLIIFSLSNSYAQNVVYHYQQIPVVPIVPSINVPIVSVPVYFQQPLVVQYQPYFYYQYYFQPAVEPKRCCLFPNINYTTPVYSQPVPYIRY